MPSSSRPYKSKLLRFVLQQWQQGLERQDRAWRQLQSTATWGAQVVILPVYAIVRAVERASFAFDSGSDGSPGHQAASKQPISPAKRHITDFEHSLTAVLSYTQQLLSIEQKKKLAIAPNAPKPILIDQSSFFLSSVIDKIRQQFTGHSQQSGKELSIAKYHRQLGGLEHRVPGVLTSRKTAGISRRQKSGLLQNGTTLASALKTRKLVLVNLKNEVFDIFTSEQAATLQYYIARIINAYEKSRGPTSTLVPQKAKRLSIQTRLAIEGQGSYEHSYAAILSRIQQLLSPKQEGQLTSYPKHDLAYPSKDRLSIHHRSNPSNLMQNGITLASSLKTRKLVLVNLKNEVFDTLTSKQQTNLKSYISEIMQAYRQVSAIVPRQPKLLSPKTILTVSAAFMVALPAELQKAWSQIAPGQKSISLPPIKSNGPQPKSHVFYPSSATAGAFKARARLSNKSASAASKLSSKDPHAFEANVNHVSYLEHPLERILRWIDRVLTWCERRWQQWLGA